ncbi:Serine Protease Inhibitor Kazal-Type 5 [Manis pentadactyla]|nr:Serine Protease Inhibitor Kazal-Type 5 [Manis pentadactyla]
MPLRGQLVSRVWAPWKPIGPPFCSVSSILSKKFPAQDTPIPEETVPCNLCNKTLTLLSQSGIIPGSLCQITPSVNTSTATTPPSLPSLPVTTTS